MNQLNIALPEQISGATELRTVLIGRDLIQPRASHVHWVSRPDQPVPTAASVDGVSRVHVQCDGATSIELLHHSESIGSIQGTTGDIDIDPKKYGGGPLRVRPLARIGDQAVFGRPLTVPLPVIVEPFPQPKPPPKAKK